MEILCSFRLVLEGKIGKEIQESLRLGFLKKFLEYNFALSDERRYSRFTFIENTISNLPKVLRARFLGKWWTLFVLLAYASLAGSRTLLQQSLVCVNFTLDTEDSFCWYKWKKWFLWTMAAAQTDENHGDEWGLTLYLYDEGYVHQFQPEPIHKIH